MVQRKPTLIIHGATSFTAKHLLTYLADHPRTADFEFILAGRNQQKLDSVNNGLKRKREVFVVNLDDEESVKDLMELGDVVLNLSGPFGLYNAEALVRECAQSGKHYVDLTGESGWVSKHVIPKYNYLATKTGSCIVTSCGFDSVPSDISVYNALSTLQQTYPSLTITKSTSIFAAKASVSGGTLSSLFTLFELPKDERRMGEWCMTPDRYPSTPLQLTYSLSHRLIPTISKIGGMFIMYPYNRCIVRRSWYLSRIQSSTPIHQKPSSRDNGENGYSTRSKKSINEDEDENEAGRGKGGREPVHGDGFIYKEGLQASNWFIAMFITIGMGFFFGLMALSGLFRSLLKWVLPSPGEGASDESLKKGWVKVTNISETTDPNVVVLTTLKAQGDPGYWSTCHYIAESALSLVLPPPKGTSLPPLSQRGGCLTPSTAMGRVLIERMRTYGDFELSSEIIEGDRKNR